MSKGAAILPNLADWPVAELADVSSMLRRGTAPVYVDSSEIHAIGQRCVTRSDFDESFTRPHSSRAVAKVVRPQVDDVLLNSTGTGTIGRSIVFPSTNRQFIVDGHVTVIRPDPSKSTGAWINEQLRSPWGQAYLESHCYAGSTNQMELSASALAAVQVAIPPYSEQRRIAEILDTLDDQIRATEQVIAKLTLAKTGYSDDSFGYASVSDWKSAPLGQLLAHLIDYRGRTPRKLGMNWGGGEILALSANNVQMGGVDTSKEAYFGSEALYARWMTNGTTKLGDILMTLEAPLGNIAQVPDNGKYILSQRVVLLRFDESRFLNRFAYWYLRSQPLQQELVRNSTGTTASGIRRASLEKISVPVPGMAEQCKIADTLFAFESKIAAEQRDLMKLRLQKQGLMSDLLTGRVRVPLESVS